MDNCSHYRKCYIPVTRRVTGVASGNGDRHFAGKRIAEFRNQFLSWPTYADRVAVKFVPAGYLNVTETLTEEPAASEEFVAVM